MLSTTPKQFNVFLLLIITGYFAVWSLPEHLKLQAISACVRERIAYYALEHGSLGNKVAHFVYPKIERATKAGCSIASDYGSQLFYGRDLEALEILEKSLKVRRKAYGDTDGRTIRALISIAVPYRESGQYQKAIDCANEVIKDFDGQPLCEEVVCANRILISNYSAMQDYELACLTCEKLIAMEEAAGELPRFLIYDYKMLSYHYRDAGRIDKQAEMERRVKQIESAPRFNHPTQMTNTIKMGCKCSEEASNLFDLIE